MDWNADIAAITGSDQEMRSWLNFPGDEAGMSLEDPGNWYDFSEVVVSTNAMFAVQGDRP